MKISTVVKQFDGSGHVLRCPLCKGNLMPVSTGSFVCSNGHCFDLSSKGYLNLIPHQNQSKIKYDGALFESRSLVFNDGFYAPVVSQLLDALQKHGQEKSLLTMLDAGSGEGYYSLALKKALPDVDVYAVDNSRDAALLAARRSREVKWIVADLAELPVKDHCVDLLLNILTPANYNEFMRVLAPGGILLKIVPGDSYLQEIRNCIKSGLHRKTYSNQKVLDYFYAHTKLLEQKKISYRLPVDRRQLEAFFRMTPMTFGIDAGPLDCGGVTHITIDLILLAGTHPSE
ncbi:MAG: methyltransferase domain-containing protein [Christensenella hongkongensis]|uniref:putative RNA methyltransferase n=1 Tax=Christensenella hongkongensis TaxID=270498 RepID=UPI002673B229|nr:methyltransferase domain-containing protein [Christensenella hongkongensis]MDY3003836.1 methyltransferase domain-containing protein [Christensenella hongkongensis]